MADVSKRTRVQPGVKTAGQFAEEEKLPSGVVLARDEAYHVVEYRHDFAGTRAQLDVEIDRLESLDGSRCVAVMDAGNDWEDVDFAAPFDPSAEGDWIIEFRHDAPASRSELLDELDSYQGGGRLTAVLDQDGDDVEVENIPCGTCGRTDMPLHHDHQCPNCFLPNPGDID